jgi:hypothetical protein
MTTLKLIDGELALQANTHRVKQLFIPLTPEAMRDEQVDCVARLGPIGDPLAGALPIATHLTERHEYGRRVRKPPAGTCRLGEHEAQTDFFAGDE